MKKTHRFKPVEPLTDFAKAESKLLKHWYKSGIIDKYLHRNDQVKKTFSFLDGPITANNPMGVHHGWGRTYKDLWQRYYNMRGLRQRFQNGFDAQGLWVEVEVEKELGFKNKKDIERYGVAKFVDQCKARVAKFSKIQTEQSQRLGYFMDWDNSYFTHSDQNNYMIWHFLKVCHENGWLYKGKESVPWCPRCQTAISQHEMLTEDYQEVTHQSIYLALPIRGKKNEYLLIWTTTPWTIPANIAVAVDKTLDYALVKVGKYQYWVAAAVVERVFGPSKHKIVKKLKGSKLDGLRYSGPFDDLPAVKTVARKNPKTFHHVVVTINRILPISTTEGTGLVHTAVSAGTEDFKLGQKLGLPMVPIIADNADYLEDLGFLSGQNAKKHPEIVLDYLAILSKKPGQHWVYKIGNYRHRYPGCWRCKTELVWKVTDEWYIAMDKPSKLKGQNSKLTLRERMKKVAKRINWIPEFGLDRELDWLTNMRDWLISKKNRYWGLCLPIWECASCGHFEVLGSKAELKKRAVTGWKEFEGLSPHKPQIDKIKIKCGQCSQIVSRIEPVGNPWLDAGIVSFSTIARNNKGKPLYLSDRASWKNWFPADFITESFPGQFKNWFYSLIAMSAVLENTNPYQTVLGFATLLAEDGRPMHKSSGNSIEFNEAADKIGVDIMRWLYCRQNPTANLLFGYAVAAKVKRGFHLILWNSYRFFANYASLEKWSQSKVSPTDFSVLDRWLLSRLSHTQEGVEQSLNDYNSSRATKYLEDFVTDLSTWYIRRSRHRIGPNAKSSSDKNTCYFILHLALVSLCKLLAPFIPFMTDRIYTNLTGQESVHLADWPKFEKKWQDKNLEQAMQLLRQITEKGHRQRKQNSLQLRQPLSQLTISGHPNKLPDKIIYLLRDELNVKHISWGKKSGQLTVSLKTTLTPELKAEGQARELIREIQAARKKANTRLDEKITVKLPSWPKEFASEIKQKTLARKLIKGPSLQIIRK